MLDFLTTHGEFLAQSFLPRLFDPEQLDLQNGVEACQNADCDPGVPLAFFINRIINILLASAYPIAFAGILYSAWILVRDSSDPAAYGKVKKNISYLAGGFLIILVGLYGIRFVVTFFGE
jgi:hypothetical protein